MTRILYLKPAAVKDGSSKNGGSAAGDKLIRDPATGQPLPPHGAAVESSPFWHAALRVGDVEKTSAEAIAKAEKAPVAATPPKADQTTARSKSKD